MSWEVKRMRRIALSQGSYASARNKDAKSVACIAFVAVLGVAFWSGAVWIGETLVRLSTGAY